MAVYVDRTEHKANQGDIFDGVPFTAYVPGQPTLGMIVSHDCDCDKFLKPTTPVPDQARPLWPITVAPVHLIDALDGARIKLIREDRMDRYFHLPEANGLPELVADLWLEQPVPIVDVLECERQASLSDEWRGRLWAQIVRLRTRRDLPALETAIGGAS